MSRQIVKVRLNTLRFEPDLLEREASSAQQEDLVRPYANVVVNVLVDQQREFDQQLLGPLDDDSRSVIIAQRDGVVDEIESRIIGTDQSALGRWDGPEAVTGWELEPGD